MLRKLKTSALAISQIPPNCYENGQHNATRFCTTCRAPFCESCFSVVHCSKILSGHESVPVAVSQVTIAPPECQIHPDKHVKYVCKDETCQNESKLICEECTQHRGHIMGYYVSVANQIREKLQKTVALLQETEANLLQKMSNAQNCKRSFDKCEMKYLEKVSDIIEHFETQKDFAIQKFADFADYEAHKMDLEMISIEFDAKRMVRMRQELQNVLSSNVGLLEVEDLISKAERMCQLEKERKENFYSLSDYNVQNDMSSTPKLLRKISVDQSAEAIEMMMLGLGNI
ncbi:hypothetical protein CRE_06982 [Caenorhabditis remanei]|uniref:B box-type domain-containing protein n=1 Tax=Caenorhabditis remanei TaxID=31234 RepID=E3NB10_CAERE|nr:hypothetical protein CRE_06982 [Caenorhabditis remanei]